MQVDIFTAMLAFTLHVELAFGRVPIVAVLSPGAFAFQVIPTRLGFGFT